MRFVFVLFTILLSNIFTFSQDTTLVLLKGEWSIPTNNGLSKPANNILAYFATTEKLVFDYFGSGQISDYAKYTETTKTGEYSVKGKENIFHFRNMFTNGEWIKDKEKPIYTEYQDKNDIYWTKCFVEGYARRIPSNQVKFELETLRGTDIMKDRTTSFNDQEHFYLYFNIAEPGYILICCSDLDTVYRCLPYQGMKDTTVFKVEANRKYLFFSEDSANYNIDKSLVDEMVLQTKKELEYNLFYIIYSKKKFNAAPLFSIPDRPYSKGYSLPKSTTHKKFTEWLQKERFENKDLQMNIIGITIKK